MTSAAAILEARRAQLARLHPLKSEHRDRAQELYNQAHQIKGEAKERETVREITQSHPFDLFVTPPDLAAHMVEMAIEPVSELGVWLEPSAGTGNIAQAIRNAGFPVTCIELNYNAAEYLKSKGFNTICGDFLEYNHAAQNIVMNPPFSNNQDIDHVLHAYELLNKGGRIVAIMSPHAFFADDKKSREFREWFTGTSEELPAGTFKTSGTNVSARLVIIDK